MRVKRLLYPSHQNWKLITRNSKTMNKTVLGLSIALAVLTALLGAGTWAYFNDHETSTGNVILAGTLNLDLVSGNPGYSVLFDLNNKAPGDSGSSSAGLTNTGSLEGNLHLGIGSVSNSENYSAVTDEAEAQDDDDTSDETGGGELGACAWMAIWLDYESGGSWDAGDIGLRSGGDTYSYAAPVTGTATGGSLTTVVNSGASWTPDALKGLPVTVSGKGTGVIIANTATTLTAAVPFTSAVTTGDTYSIASGPIYDLIDSYSGDVWESAALMPESGSEGDEWEMVIEWVIPGDTTDNRIMGDEVRFNLDLELEQVH